MNISSKAIKSISVLLSIWFFTIWLLFCVPGRSMADGQNSSPERKSTSAELLMDEEFHPTPGTYYYDVFLSGVRLGKAAINVEKQGDEYSVAVTAKTRRSLSNLYKIKYRGVAVITSDPIVPRSAVIEQQSGSKRKTITMEFPEPNRVKAVQLESKKGKEPKRTEKEFESESFVLDPFSTVFLIRNLKWEIGTKEIFDVFTGRKQYQLELLCKSEIELEVDGKLREAWMIYPQTRSLKDPREVKMSSFVIYISKDSRKEILKITGEPKIGRIVAKMRNS